MTVSLVSASASVSCGYASPRSCSSRQRRAASSRRRSPCGRSIPRSRTKCRRSSFTHPDSPAIQTYGRSAAGSAAARRASRAAGDPSVPLSSRTSQVISASASVARSWMSPACGHLQPDPGAGAGRQRLDDGRGGRHGGLVAPDRRRGRCPRAAGTGSPGCRRRPGRAAGPGPRRRPGRPSGRRGRPGRGRPARCRAGRSRCRSRPGPRRRARRVYDRITARTSSGSSRQPCHQLSPSSSGTTGSGCPGCGRNSDRDWSRPSEWKACRSGPREGDPDQRRPEPPRPHDLEGEEAERGGYGGSHVRLLDVRKGEGVRRPSWPSRWPSRGSPPEACTCRTTGSARANAR